VDVFAVDRQIQGDVAVVVVFLGLSALWRRETRKAKVASRSVDSAVDG